LHERTSLLCGQATPPLDGWTLARVRVCLPLPHDLVQVVQVEKAATAQSTAHRAALQARVSA
jgi:hypothetical protein